jgi:phosphomannomutase
MFPNHAPNPEEKEAMESATKAVLKAKADLGIVFDTDVDRSAVIDSFGKEINRNKLIAVLSHIALQKEPGSTIVTDSVTSSGLKSFIENLGGKHLRYMRGYKNVINKGMELNKEGINAPLMIETSGHGAMKENYNLDDGAYLAVKIIIEAVKRKNAGGSGIGEILKNLKEPLESIECRLKISNAEFKKVGSEVIEKFTAAIDQGYFEPGFVSAKENFEGIRAESQGKGWFLLRSSLHDPVMVLNIESDEKGGVSNYAKQIDKWFSENRFEDVDYSSIATKI